MQALREGLGQQAVLPQDVLALLLGQQRLHGLQRHEVFPLGELVLRYPVLEEQVELVQHRVHDVLVDVAQHQPHFGQH